MVEDGLSKRLDVLNVHYVLKFSIVGIAGETFLAQVPIARFFTGVKFFFSITSDFFEARLAQQITHLCVVRGLVLVPSI